MAETFYPYDSAQHLKTDEDIALYMEAVMEEAGDDSGFITHALGVVARARNMSQLARDAGMTREGLYKALSADGNPSFATIAKVAGALGLRLAFQPVRSVARSARGRAVSPSRRTNATTKPRKAGAKPGRGTPVHG